MRWYALVHPDDKGYDGGEIKGRGLADLPIVVCCDCIPRIQEVQASIYHIIREMQDVLSLAKLELFGTASCPYTQEMRQWLEWKRYDFVVHRAGPRRGRQGRADRPEGRGCVICS